MWVLFLVVWVGARTAYAGDPYLAWHTIETPHFRVHYHTGLEALAQRTATLAEQLDFELSTWLGNPDREPTELVLTDTSDDANGYTSVLPYSSVTLLVAAPDDMSLLGDTDDWPAMLTAHEMTHVVHTDNVAGLPALVRTLLGKLTAPNHLMPRWLIEGLAVMAETRLSSGGRLRSTQAEMFLRANVIENRLPTLDQISGLPSDWPGATVWYLHGGKFLEFVESLYGPSVFAVISAETSDDVMPFAVGRAFYHATGRTVEELYRAYQERLKRRVAEQLARVNARGIREGRRLTWQGGSIAHPRFLPQRCSSSSNAALVYARDDGHERPGLYTLSMNGEGTEARLLTRVAGGDVATPTSNCRLVFESIAPSRRLHYFHDLFQVSLEATPEGPGGIRRERLTTGRRATEPDVSHDGRWIVYVTNRAGTTRLRLAAYRDGRLRFERPLTEEVPGEQVFTPRFSPDDRYVAYGVWTRGGYRDLRILEVSSGRIFQPWRDRFVEQQPSWSPDGRTLFFSSDRSGISNIYALELGSGRLHQVTNVKTGAFMPEVSPDGSRLVYVGYGSDGFDLYALDLDPKTWLVPDHPRPLPPDRIPLADRGQHSVSNYSAWPSLRPRALHLDYRSGEEGQRLILSASGSDAVGLYGVSASAVFEPEGNDPDLFGRVSYHRLPFSFSFGAHRLSDPSNRYEYGSISPEIVEIRSGLSTRVDFNLPEEFSGQNLGLEYEMSWLDARLPTGTAADPYATVPIEPRRGLIGAVHLNYSYSDVETQTYSVSRERGSILELNLDRADRRLGSELEGTSTMARYRHYVPMPYLRHHTLAFSATLGASSGAAGSGYSLGGYQDSELLRNLLAGIGQSRMSLRGYPSQRFRGNRLVLGQVEYRWPLAIVDHGLGTLPLFLRRIHAALGADYGGAFRAIDPDDPTDVLHLGLTAELWFDLFLGYRRGARLGLGYAAGKGEGAIVGGTGYLLVISAL